jgi:hypothetical protein
MYSYRMQMVHAPEKTDTVVFLCAFMAELCAMHRTMERMTWSWELIFKTTRKMGLREVKVYPENDAGNPYWMFFDNRPKVCGER